MFGVIVMIYLKIYAYDTREQNDCNIENVTELKKQ